MEKRKIGNLPVLLTCSIPWAFLALFGDKELHTVLLYGLWLLAAVVLGWLARKSNAVSPALMGNLLSCLISLLCAHCLTDWESWYFKPLGITGWVIALSVFSLMMQFLIWNYKQENEPAKSLLVAVCAVAAALVAAVVILLVCSAVVIGAI